MEWFFETRFGDPVLSLYMTRNSLVYGTALGQIGFFDISVKAHTLLTEMAEESIRGIYLAQDFSIFAAVGDLYVLSFYKRPEEEAWSYDTFNHEGRVHTSLLCHSTQILQDGPKVCLVTIEEELEALAPNNESLSRCFVTDPVANDTKEFKGLILPKFSVPLDFEGERLLWLERNLSSERVLRLMYFTPFAHQTIRVFESNEGHLSLFKLCDDTVFYVQNFRTLCTVSTLGEAQVKVYGIHSADIVAIFPIKKAVSHPSEPSSSRERICRDTHLVVALDMKGHLCIWGEGFLFEEMDVTVSGRVEIDSSERLFALGYPYCVFVYSPLIAFTCDLGVFLVKSTFLSTLESEIHEESDTH